MNLLILLCLFLSASYDFVKAFPLSGGAIDEDAVVRLSEEVKELLRRASEKRLVVNTITVPIEVTGDHAFIAPDFEAGDQRSPCPGLNVLANHGYISRDGVTTLGEIVPALNEVWGMGLDLSLGLAIMGVVFVGNPLSLSPGFSIGGPTPKSSNLLDNLLGLLGTPRGLIGSHNIIECDASMTREDYYATGDAVTMNLTKFTEFYDSAIDGEYTWGLLTKRAQIRFQESVATNPNFYFGPFTGLVVRNAGYALANRLFRNHSQENPQGVLNQNTLKSIFAVSGDEGNFTYNRGWERLPENWYKTPIDYGLVGLNLDIVDMVAQYPEMGSIGGNTGTVNSFSGIDLTDLTGGALNAATLLEGNILVCLAFELVKTVAPNSLSTLFSLIDGPLGLLTDTLNSALFNLSCPAFEDLTIGGDDFESGAQSRFPGAAKSLSVL